MLDLLIIGFDSLTEIIGAIFVCEVSDDGNGLIGFHIGKDFGGVYNYLSMENLLVDVLIEVVGDGSDKHALCEVRNLAWRYKTIELRGDGSRLVVAVNGHRLALLEDFSGTFGDGLGSFTYDLTIKDVSHGVLDNLTLLISVITRELREVLEAQTNCHFVRASCGNEVIQTTEVDGR